MVRQLREMARRLVLGVRRAVRQPRSELDRWGRSVRFLVDVSRVGALQLRQDRAPQMAAALAFRTLFALAPVLVVVTIVVRAVAGLDEFQRIAGSLLDAAGLADVQISFPNAVGTESAAHTESLKDWLSRVLEQATQVTLPAVGWVGFVMIIYAAISLLRTIEQSFNVIYRAPSNRPRTRSIPLYWFLLTVSPLAISLASWAHSQVQSWGNSLAWSRWTMVWFDSAWTIGVTWALLTMMFVLVPNTAVTLRPATAGALVSVVLLELGKRTIGQYLASSFALSQLVTSLGLIPLFMFWVYLMWLAVLFGLEVSAILQQLGGRKLEEMERATQSIEIADPAVVVAIMQTIAGDFRASRSTPAASIAAQTRLSQRQVDLVLRRLVHADLVHAVEGADERYCLARPPEEIAASQLLDIGFALADSGRQGELWTVIERLRAAQRTAAATWTLDTLSAGS